MAQKYAPLEFRCLPLKRRAIDIVPLPFKYPAIFETTYFGGTLRYMNVI
jgi:hypothetical protein